MFWFRVLRYLELLKFGKCITKRAFGFCGAISVLVDVDGQGALAIRRIFSLVDMITKPKFSNCPNIFLKLDCFGSKI